MELKFHLMMQRCHQPLTEPLRAGTIAGYKPAVNIF